MGIQRLRQWKGIITVHLAIFVMLHVERQEMISSLNLRSIRTSMPFWFLHAIKQVSDIWCIVVLWHGGALFVNSVTTKSKVFSMTKLKHDPFDDIAETSNRHTIAKIPNAYRVVIIRYTKTAWYWKGCPSLYARVLFLYWRFIYSVCFGNSRRFVVNSVFSRLRHTIFRIVYITCRSSKHPSARQKHNIAT